MLALQIAAGIVLAAVALRFWRQGLTLALWVVGAVLLLFAGLWASSWTGEDWLAIAVAAAVIVGGLVAYPRVARLEAKRRQR